MTENLTAERIDLTGSHLIEASAGTGKTFNITRIYLRMLLERQLSVEQILVMTFTKAATEEIRGRIDAFLRDTLQHWDVYTADEGNPYFYHLGQVVERAYAIVAIKHALINLDQAAIYTIHGFCSRILSEQAFASGVNFSSQMETDDSSLYIQACQDHYRLLQHNNEATFQKLVQLWPTPEDFSQQFSAVLRSNIETRVDTKASVISQIIALAEQGYRQLLDNEVLLARHLIDNKSGKTHKDRIAEWQHLLSFCQSLKAFNQQYKRQLQANDINDTLLQDFAQLLSEKANFNFVSTGRFGKDKAIKATLNAAVSYCHALEKHVKAFAKLQQSVASYEVLLDAITDIKAKVLDSKEQLMLLGFDDLIVQLQQALMNERQLPQKPLTQALQQQYPVALVDEFQDTDAQQFSILSDVYIRYIDDDNALALYLIGDPKQAIYGFRGGDIFTYLKAADVVNKRWFMDTNWRSSAAMVNAYNHLFYGGDINQDYAQVFGYGIDYQPVLASPKASESCLLDDVDSPSATNMRQAAMRFVQLDDEQDYHSRGKAKADFRQHLASWCAAEITRLLTTARIKKGEQQASLSAADIAVLVRDGTEAKDIQQALNDANIASVYKSQRDNLFHSLEASDAISVLKAIINCRDDKQFVAALATCYFGFDSIMLTRVNDDEAYYEQVKSWFFELHQLWMRRGFMAMALKLLHDYYPRHKQANERQLTNMLHLFEVLQSASQTRKQPQQLLAYLIEQCHNPFAEVAELRLESDANLVQIVTQHGSKGLEYPVVFVPFSSRHKDPSKQGTTTKKVIKYHDDDNQLALHIGDNKQYLQRMVDESYAEDIRLLYVAITRAEHLCYLPVAQFADYHKSPIGHVLKMQQGQDFAQTITQLAANCPEDMCYQRVSSQPAAPLPVQGDGDVSYQVQHFSGRIERDWWLSSFSALTRNLRHSGRQQKDRDQLDGNDTDSQQASDAIRFTFPKGAQSGNLLHDVLEHSDFAQPNWSKVADFRLQKLANLTDGFKLSSFYAWLDSIVAAPFNQQGLSLSQLPYSNTLREAEFYFPMEQVNLAELNFILTEFRTSLGHKNTQLKTLSLPEHRALQGMMHGFIDLIFKDNASDCYYVADYKSSYLGDSMADYTPTKLSEHVITHAYDLQFLIYALALHRYLQERMSDYQFAQHFGGVYYFYLRGMSDRNLDTQGIFYHPLSATLLDSLNAVFSGHSLSAQQKQLLVEDFQRLATSRQWQPLDGDNEQQRPLMDNNMVSK
ncbi:exodeoxyribonuclease V subunit beta [Thalassotalea maritima]|uniref:exodeoxyribonuclease V subunit beta n=1 Tax=Thalassotalea maritima TaxID=3242416 RepID=UPI00352943EE